MSQMVTRQSGNIEDKEQQQTQMKKKMAANLEKDKQTTEKGPDKHNEKHTEKLTEKHSSKHQEKHNEKTDKNKVSDKSLDKKAPEKLTEKKEGVPEKAAEKKDKLPEKTNQTGHKKTPDRSVEKQGQHKPSDKLAEKKDKGLEKTAEKKDKVPEKAADKTEAIEKTLEKKDKQTEKSAEKKEKAPEKVPDKVADKKEHGERKTVPHSQTHRKEENEKPKTNGKADKAKASNGEQRNGDTEWDSDEAFPELVYDDDADDFDVLPTDTSRSITRRSQVKATRTPETPRPASVKQTDAPADDSKEKLLKLRENAPSPAGKRPQGEGDSKKMEVEVLVEVEPEEPPRKSDTNFSKSRVKVSPYRRSGRHHDVTISSVAANYTGNNSTMETDLTASFVEEAGADASYLSGLRTIRGRPSYKLLAEYTVKKCNTKATTEAPQRPTGTVVGRKRKPEPDADPAIEALHLLGDVGPTPAVVDDGPAPGKRMRLLDRLALPFKRTTPPLPRSASQIVGINSDLPLSAPVAAPAAPEPLKPADPVPPGPATAQDDKDKRCVVM